MRIRRLFLPIILVALIISLVPGTGCDLFSGLEEPSQNGSSLSDGEDATAIDPDWQAPLLDNLSGPLPSIADVVAMVKPSVVAITTEMVSFGYTTEGGGSGWIIDESGIIVTNAHVVSEADSITVTLDDGRVIPVVMSTMAIDVQTDLAVLKVNVGNLPAVVVGDSEQLRVGDWVVAIGNSLGLGVRATVGIVSQSEVTVNEELGQPLRLIETDAAINPGNSGGPLVNMAGEVIGINEAKVQDIQVEGVGWAIASTDALPIIQSLINKGYVIRPWLGVGTQTVNPTVAFWNQLAVSSGVLITSVSPGSPADTAGLKAGDVVVSFRGVEVTTDYQMVRGIHTAEIGQTVEIVYWSGNSRYTTEATLVESPPPQG